MLYCHFKLAVQKNVTYATVSLQDSGLFDHFIGVEDFAILMPAKSECQEING